MMLAQSGVMSIPDAAIPAPIYSILSNVEGAWETQGLRVNTTNSYGVISAAGGLTTWTGLTPGPTDRTFSQASGTINAKLVAVNRVFVLDCNGITALLSNGSSVWNFLHYNATFANLKWTIHILCRIGFGGQPGEFYGIIGNSGATQSKKGISIYYEDRASNNNRLITQIAKGTTGLISSSSDDNKVTPNEWHIYTWTFDGSLTAANRMKYYVDGTQVAITVTSASTAVVTAPTHNLQVFATGNDNGTTAGQISNVIIQSTVETDAVRNAFIQSMIPWKLELSAIRGALTHIYNTEQGNLTRYYINGCVLQNPTSPGTLIKLWREDDGHIITSTGTLQLQKSTDYGLTWGAQSTFYDPAGALAPNNFSAGYDASGKLFVITDVHTTSAGDGTPYYCMLLTSTDNGDTSPTAIDITASLASDGLSFFNCWGQLIVTHTGRLIAPYYKLDSGAANSACYVLVSDDSGASWTSKTVKASSSTYHNESNMVEVNTGATYRLIQYIRSEVTFEYNCYSSTDDGNTWTDNGAQSLGESFTTASPGTFSKFVLNGQTIVCFTYSNRGAARQLKAIYGKATSLAGNPITGMDTDTRTVIFPDQVAYGTVCHPFNSLYGIGCYMREPATFTGTENKLITIYTSTNQEPTIISELGL